MSGFKKKPLSVQVNCHCVRSLQASHIQTTEMSSKREHSVFYGPRVYYTAKDLSWFYTIKIMCILVPLLYSRHSGNRSDHKSRLATSEAWERKKDFSFPDSARHPLIDSYSSPVLIVFPAPNPFWSLHKQHLWKKKNENPFDIRPYSNSRFWNNYLGGKLRHRFSFSSGRGSG